MREILTIAPTKMELSHLESALPRSSTRLVTGIGPVNTAISFYQWLIDNPRPRLVILLGLCGTYKIGVQGTFLSVGDVALAQSECYGDLGRCGGQGIDPIEMEGERQTGGKLEAYPLKDLPFIGEALEAISPKAVPMTTVMCTSATFERAHQVHLATGAWCEEMEGAPIFEIASRFDIPFVEIRGVSNVSGDRRENWNIKGALLALNHFLKEVFS